MALRSTGRVLLIVTVLFVAPAAVLPAPVGAAPGATITGAFADLCRTFTAHSGKDISHVEVHYADGRVVKDEAVNSPDYALHGSAVNITSVEVKSSTTRMTFSCTLPSSPPTAYLEIFVHDGCSPDGFGDPPYMLCFGVFERSVWVRPSGLSDGNIQIGVTRDRDVIPQLTWSFRGTSSSDPDDDIVSWSLDFGDGSTPVAGTWGTEPPAEVTHTFASCVSADECTVPTVTLTVIDAGGHSDIDTLTINFFDATPD